MPSTYPSLLAKYSSFKVGFPDFFIYIMDFKSISPLNFATSNSFSTVNISSLSEVLLIVPTSITPLKLEDLDVHIIANPNSAFLQTTPSTPNRLENDFKVYSLLKIKLYSSKFHIPFSSLNL